MKRDTTLDGSTCPHCGRPLGGSVTVTGFSGPALELAWVVCRACARFAVLDAGKLRKATTEEFLRAESGPIGGELLRWRDRLLAERACVVTVVSTDSLEFKKGC